MEEFTQTIKTDDGYHLIRYRKVGEVGVTRRDDLRGCWEVSAAVFGSREEAFAYAEDVLNTEVMTNDEEGQPIRDHRDETAKPVGKV